MHKHFLGTFRIHLDHLSFDWIPTAYLDEKNVERLELAFKKDCQRLLKENRISAVINKSSLGKATPRGHENSIISLSFDSEVRLKCLNGKHRIAAAKGILYGEDRWWSVNLYDVER